MNDIQKLDTLGIGAYIWTANSKSDWARLKDIGVTGIIIDRPKDLANWLKE
ncbi:glycerophosphodiester phosphodiesterase family protein [Psychrobacter celer]|uniref:glycerophosphodiester phosphodiesterase family protein n=1 Tax=Psychrobacter celer TaxID=306572 RepID=UPI003FD3FE1D